MNDLVSRLQDIPAVAEDPIASHLAYVVSLPTGMSSAGYPYLDKRAWEYFRDHVPHLFEMGRHTYRCATALAELVDDLPVSDAERENVRNACRVIRQIVFTATITAPPDLWLLRHVIGAFCELGLNRPLLEGAALVPENCQVILEGQAHALDPVELETDLFFLLSRGVVEQYDETFRIAGHPRARDLLDRLGPVDPAIPADVTQVWRRVFADEELSSDEIAGMRGLTREIPRRTDAQQNHWMPTREEVLVGFLLVPVVLGLRSASRSHFAAGDFLAPTELSARHPELGRRAARVLCAAGWLRPEKDAYRVTSIGERGLSRGPGPFGIIETYHPYMTRRAEILREGTSNVWVRRGENVGASQDANRRTFEAANDALDRFCADTGFRYRVFIEHAIGRGEATRQRYERSGKEAIAYFGADLEDAAIDAALEEQRAGRLPPNMVFVRQADIGDPGILIDAIERAGCDPKGAVMLVGNGFHEVRDQTDEKMVEVFRGYHDAGILLLFTEENALAIDDLRATAWNTYHAGFKYVHEKSGQGLRPADPRPQNRLGRPLRAAWSECAAAAGYVRLDAYCSRTRTVYPYPPRSGHNPSISVNHFFVPREIVRGLEHSPSKGEL